MNESHHVFAYVGRGTGDPTPAWKNMNYKNFGEVYRGRPFAARYVIYREHGGPIVQLDLYEVHVGRSLMTFYIPSEARKAFDDLDAAIMSAQLNL